jgi:hypothetical protein
MFIIFLWQKFKFSSKFGMLTLDYSVLLANYALSVPDLVRPFTVLMYFIVAIKYDQSTRFDCSLLLPDVCN